MGGPGAGAGEGAGGGGLIPIRRDREPAPVDGPRPPLALIHAAPSAPLFAIFAERYSLMPPGEGMVAARQAKVRLDVWNIPGARHGEGPEKAPDYYERITRYFRRLQALPRVR